MYSRIRELRKSLGMSQQDLARATDIAQAQISKYEMGKITNPSFNTLQSIATCLGVHVEDLAGEAPSNTGALSRSTFDEWSGRSRFALREIKSKTDVIPLLTSEVDTKMGLMTKYKGMDDATNAFMRRPVLVGDSEIMYAVKLSHDKMDPRIKKGETVVCVDDHDYKVGDAVSVVVKDEKYGAWCAICTLIEECDQHIVVGFLKDNERHEIVRENIKGIHRVFGTMYNS